MCVLLVEDDDLIRELMSEMLRDAGYEVVETPDGVHALQVIEGRHHQFCALLTDYHMPGNVDGAAVAEAARRAFPGIPVIIASGRPDVLRAEWRRERGYRFLEKPYLPSELLRVMKSLLDSSPS